MPTVPPVPKYRNLWEWLWREKSHPGQIYDYLLGNLPGLPFFRGPVRWLLSRALLSKAQKLIVSDLFTNQLDHRDWMPDQRLQIGGESAGVFWFDYVADTGDSQLANYNLAYLLLGALRCTAAGIEAAPGGMEAKGDGVLPRGRFLLIGGDTAYHVADLSTLTERIIWPFEWARQARNPGQPAPEERPGQAPQLFAIPGNHDLYDALIGFNNVIIEPQSSLPNAPANRDFGRVADFNRQQVASSFCIDLPFGFRLVGLDSQGGKLDYRQRQRARDWIHGADGRLLPKLIVATSQPSTVFENVSPEAVAPFLDIGLDRPFASNGQPAELPQIHLDLSGDVHHYERYVPINDGGHVPYTSVVAGGGAFMHPTQTSYPVPRLKHARAPWPQSPWPPPPVKIYPPKEQSAREVTAKLLMPWEVLRGGFIFVLGGLLAAASYHFHNDLPPAIAGSPLCQNLCALWHIPRPFGTADSHRMLAVLGMLLVALGLWLSRARAAKENKASLKRAPSYVKPGLAALLGAPMPLVAIATGATPIETYSAWTSIGLLLCVACLPVAWAFTTQYLAMLARLQKAHHVTWRRYLVAWLAMCFGISSASYGLYIYGAPSGALTHAALTLVMLAATAGLAFLAFSSGGKGQRMPVRVGLGVLGLALGSSLLFVPMAVANARWFWLVLSIAATWIGSMLLAALSKHIQWRRLYLPLCFLAVVACPLAIVAVTGGGWAIYGGSGEATHRAWLAGFAGALLTAVWFGHYLAVSLAFGGHNNEAGSTVRFDRYCHFIRFKLEEDRITGYVIGVEALVPACAGTPSAVRPKIIDVFHVGAPPLG